MMPFGLVGFARLNALLFSLFQMCQAVRSDTFAPREKYEIQKLTQKNSAVLEQVKADFEQETDKLINLEN